MGILREPRGGCGTLLPGSSNIDDQTSTGDRDLTPDIRDMKIMAGYVYRWRKDRVSHRTLERTTFQTHSIMTQD